MKTRKVLALLLALVLVASVFTACGGSSNSMAYDAPAADAPAEAPVWEVTEEDSLTSADNSQAPLPENEKIITTLHMDAETEDLETLLGGINEQVARLGGYMEAQEIYNGSNYDKYRYRYAYLTIRIPSDKLSQFVTHVEGQANVISQNTTTQNVTLTYVATESRVKALQTEETRLLELLAMAENMEDLLLIESRLTEVRTELEQVTTSLRALENKVSFSTVHLNISEVQQLTNVEEEPKTVGERISAGFADSMEDMAQGVEDFFVNLIIILPYLIPLAVISLIALVIVLLATRKARKARKLRKAQLRNPPEPPSA